jgi:hypothetical protein
MAKPNNQKPQLQFSPEAKEYLEHSSGQYIDNLSNEATHLAVVDDAEQVLRKHVEKARENLRQKVKPSILKEIMLTLGIGIISGFMVPLVTEIRMDSPNVKSICTYFVFIFLGMVLFFIGIIIEVRKNR